MKDDKITLEEIENLDSTTKKFYYVENFKKYYFNYIMSTLIERSLPDVRDGLKPVHRRILYSLNELKIFPDSSYKKSARIVGDVEGKYHPHGDSSIYDAMVRMAQSFSLRHPVIDGHGNFGNEDGDKPASMRYTEARMSGIATEMLRDINKDTVDFVPNFDGEENEPVVLPSRFPNLLVNGAEGIAVAYACKFPTHNLNEAIDQIIYQIDNPNCTIEELVNILKAPDFPTGGIIVNPDDMVDIYKQGKGKIIIRSKYEVKDNTIRITEIPYGINKMNQIAKLIQLSKGEIIKEKNPRTGKMELKQKPPIIPQIEEILDESNERHGIDIKIKVKHGQDINMVLKLIFKHTDFELSYGANFNCVCNNKLLKNISLKDINTYYINHQKDVILRRTKFDFNKLLLRKEIVEGFCIVLKDIDKSVELIRTSKNKEEAKERLMNEYNLTDKQSSAVLSLKLTSLITLEVQNYIDELVEINKEYTHLNNIINNENELLTVLKNELTEIKNEYGEKRKTQLLYQDNLSCIDLSKENIKDYNCSIIVTSQGYIKKTLNHSDNQKIKENDQIIQDFKCNNRDTLFFFTNTGFRIKVPVNDLELKTPKLLGEYIPTLLSDRIHRDEEIIKVVPIPEDSKEGYIISIYENGKVSKVTLESYTSNYIRLANSYGTESKVVNIEYIGKDCDLLLIANNGEGTIINTSKMNSKTTRKNNGVKGFPPKEGYKIILGEISPSKESVLNIQLDNKKVEMRLDDIAPTNKPNEERSVYEYITGHRKSLVKGIIKSLTIE